MLNIEREKNSKISHWIQTTVFALTTLVHGKISHKNNDKCHWFTTDFHTQMLIQIFMTFATLAVSDLEKVMTLPS